MAKRRPGGQPGRDTREYPDYVPPSPPTGYAPAPLAPEIVATVKTSRFSEELGTLTKTRNYKDFGFDHYLHFGQLA